MKHTLKVTIFLIFIFITAQVIGLFLVSQTIYPMIDETGEPVKDDSGNIVVEYDLDSEPPFEAKGNLIYLVSMILVGTALVLILNKFKLFKAWKIWFYIAIAGALFLALKRIMPETIAIAIALIFAFLKLFKPNIFVHNLTELFIYGGISSVMYRWLTVPLAIVMLLIISLYDMIAVWKLKHMITLAKAQTKQKMFAGILLQYEKDKKEKTKKITKKIPKELKAKGKTQSAILGGGDIAFPLIFTATVMNDLVLSKGPYTSGLAFLAAKQHAFFVSLFIPLLAAVALFLLFVYSKKGRYYPAMPFISAGCILGFIITMVLS